MDGKNEHAKAGGASRKDVRASVLQTVALAVALLAIGLVTRGVSLCFPGLYGLHAALCAPFYAVVASIAVRKTSKALPLVLALLITAVVLGSMRPVQMGLPFLFLALFAAIAAAALRRRQAPRQIAVSLACSAPFYPLTMIVGLASGSWQAQTESVLPTLLIAGVSIGLSVIATVCLSASGSDD